MTKIAFLCKLLQYNIWLEILYTTKGTSYRVSLGTSYGENSILESQQFQVLTK